MAKRLDCSEKLKFRISEIRLARQPLHRFVGATIGFYVVQPAVRAFACWLVSSPVIGHNEISHSVASNVANV